MKTSRKWSRNLQAASAFLSPRPSTKSVRNFWRTNRSYRKTESIPNDFLTRLKNRHRNNPIPPVTTEFIEEAINEGREWLSQIAISSRIWFSKARSRKKYRRCCKPTLSGLHQGARQKQQRRGELFDCEKRWDSTDRSQKRPFRQIAQPAFTTGRLPQLSGRLCFLFSTLCWTAGTEAYFFAALLCLSGVRRRLLRIRLRPSRNLNQDKSYNQKWFCQGNSLSDFVYI